MSAYLVDSKRKLDRLPPSTSETPLSPKMECLRDDAVLELGKESRQIPTHSDLHAVARSSGQDSHDESGEHCRTEHTMPRRGLSNKQKPQHYKTRPVLLRTCQAITHMHS